MMADGGMTLGRGHSTPIDNYKRGARVWHRHAELVWIAGELQTDVTFSTTSIRILLDDGETVEYPLKSPDQLPFLRNPEILIGADDLTTLSYLHEPAVLHNVAFRFVEKEAVYTYCGIVLVAVNPYADCRDLYGDEMIQVYRGVGKQVRGLDPHIYAVAEEAFYDLAEYGKNQSVIVSGESGAGKTVSAKYVMRYFASVAGSRKGGPGIEQRVLASNPIMEAIGNAKTIRNDNSSRFGKYIQLNFGDRYAISGAEMRTYLLEKSRLVFQASNERNYHIFYQMCAAREDPLLKGMKLGSADAYHYTAQGRASLLEGVDDGEEFRATVQALTEVGFSADAQRDLLKVLAGVLTLGNVQFSAGGGDDATAVQRDSSGAVRQLCEELYGIDEADLRLWLTNREIRAVTEVVRKPLNREEASRNRDALAKMIYAHTFNWVVEKVNLALRGTFSSSSSSPSKGAPKPQRFIGVLDIYGFETFEVNSFEQFCINYANEKLQQQFNQHVFKLEQAEYEREEIAWVRIDFYDNQPCIDLIEARPGLINYLDEQCKVVKGSDPGWLDQITNCPTLKKSAQLQLPKIRSASFMIKHFAADVSYTVDGFLEKNKDTVNEQLMAVVAATKFPLLREILEPSVGDLAQAAAAGGKKMKKTVASQFRDSLKDLMTVLESTRPHYVRISAAGYPSRWNYDDFGKRYRVLYPEGRAMWRDAPRKFASAACAKHLEEGKFALGKTKMFFRTGQVALLERKRTETLKASALKIQTRWRGYVARKRYQTIRNSVKLIQAAGRAFMVYRAAKYLQMHRASIAIQTAWRRHAAEKRYSQMRKAALAIQAAFRAARVRKVVLKLRYEKSALTIQRYWRGYMVRREEIRRLRKIIKVQSCVRRFIAKRRLRKLKIEAKSVGHLQKLNSGLENKIIELQQKLDVSNAEVSRLHGQEREMDQLKMQLMERDMERAHAIALRTRLEEMEGEVEQLQMDCIIKDEEREAVVKKMELLQLEAEKRAADAARAIADAEERAAEAAAALADAEKDRRALEKALNSECNHRALAEAEMGAMREQLLANANLLASPAFSRAGSVRGEVARATMSLGGAAAAGGSPLAEAYAAGGGAAAAAAAAADGSGSIDEITLISRQQQIINELRIRSDQHQRENERLKAILDANALVDSLDKRTSLRAFENQRVQELECAYAKLKAELDRLASERAERGGVEGMDLKLLVDRTMEENERRREESVELRALLSNRFERQSTHGGGPSASPRPDSGHWSATHSEDGSSMSGDLDEELCLERQCRQLKAHIESLTRDVTDRNAEITRLERRLLDSAPVITKYSETSTEDSIRSIHGQLNHLVLENLIIRLETLSKESCEHSALLEVFNVPEFARVLVCDLKPRLARLITKCFPAYCLLVAFRYHDHARDEASLTGLFNTVHIMLKDTLTNSRDLDVLSLWLVNTWRLFNLLRQYSGEAGGEEWHAQNTERQNAQRMQAFDVEPIRRQLKSRVDDAYQALMKHAIEPVLNNKIVPGILQHESDWMNGGGKKESKEGKDGKALDDLIDLLNFIHAKLSVYGADPVLLGTVFGQISAWICALALNHLMFRKELCNFEKAIQIKHNVTEVQSWLHSKGLGEHRAELEPLVQASHLLQSKKDEANIDTLCGEMTSKLKPRQVVAILQHYAPSDGFEERCLDADFLVKVQKKLNERNEPDPDSLIMMGTYLKPFDSRAFVYSEFQLESLALPSCLHLNQVSRIFERSKIKDQLTRGSLVLPQSEHHTQRSDDVGVEGAFALCRSDDLHRSL
ncbi:hum-2 [Pristionchus pacificus]|nr:hum-2 [Pristionchus pacificus]|eukprot:PDM72080.1 Myosin head [Pristionchus pacificus]